MYCKTAAALAILGFSARFALAYDPFSFCCPTFCGDDILIGEPCCAPVCCEPLAAPVYRDEAAPLPPASLPDPPTDEPTPADEPQPSESNRPAPPPGPGPLPEEELIQPEEMTPAAPPPSTFREPARPTTEEVTAPPAPEGDPDVAPAAVEPTTDGPSRYTPLPQATPSPDTTTPVPGALEDPFTEAPVLEEEPAEAEREPAPSGPEQPSLEEQLFDQPSPAPATSDAPPAPAEQPAEQPAEPSGPDAESLFGPSAASSVLGEPGGWASTSDRTWTDAAGDALGPARLSAINGDYVTLRTDDGGEHVVRFNELSRDDLGFLRRQINARQTELAQKAKSITRLATSDQ